MSNWKEELGKFLNEKGVKKPEPVPLTEEEIKNAIEVFYRTVTAAMHVFKEELDTYDDLEAKIKTDKDVDDKVIKSRIIVYKSSSENFFYEASIDNSLHIKGYACAANLYGEAANLKSTKLNLSLEKITKDKVLKDIKQAFEYYFK